ncbi:hypothetical protein [Ferrimicrobium acidiphilum]|nr:hypothetical protein [Ferrimicrobium acidiphilum]
MSGITLQAHAPTLAVAVVPNPLPTTLRRERSEVAIAVEMRWAGCDA